MVVNNRPNDDREQRSGFVRFLIGLFKFILLLAVLAVGGFLGWLGWQQFQIIGIQSGNQTNRINSLREDIVYESEINSMIRDQVNPEVAALSAEIELVEDQMGEIDALKSDLAKGLSDQGSLIADLQSQQADMAAALSGLDTGLATMQTDVADITETAAQLRRELALRSQGINQVQQTLSTLETQIGTLETDLTELSATLPMTATETAADEAPEEEDAPADDSDGSEDEGNTGNEAVADADSDGAKVDYRYISLYGSIIRGKIHINEGDLDSAAAAIESAQAAVATLSESAEGEAAASLAVVGENIDSAADSLAEKPTLSNLALDDAWTAMDALLLLLSGN